MCFEKIIGYYVTGMTTTSHKTSIIDGHHQKYDIGDEGDKIIKLILELLEYCWVMSRETQHQPPVDMVGSSRLHDSSHRYATLNYLLDKRKTRILNYLLFKMICMGMDQSNNVLQFAKFCDKHYHA
jgi:hypothetical protein